MGRQAICLVISVVLLGCVSAKTLPDGTTEVRTFGAAEVEVGPGCALKTKSAGVSEGFADFLKAIPAAALRIVGAIGAGFAEAPKEKETTDG